MDSRIREIANLLRTKGFKYTYNRVHFYVFWCWIENHPRLIRMLNCMRLTLLTLKLRLPLGVIKEIWRGEKYNLLRKAIREGKAPAPCKTCCLFSTKDGKSCES